MLCQLCQKRMANVHFTQVVNNKKTEMYICEECANERGQAGLNPLLSIGDFLSSYIGYGNNETHTPQEPEQTRCDICGMSYEDFKKAGKVGCGNCYRVFGEQLRPVLKRLHGTTGHVGKVPEKLSKSIRTDREIETLKKLLAKAVQNEEYEKAADIRDKIKMMESGR